MAVQLSKKQIRQEMIFQKVKNAFGINGGFDNLPEVEKLLVRSVSSLESGEKKERDKFINKAFEIALKENPRLAKSIANLLLSKKEVEKAEIEISGVLNFGQRIPEPEIDVAKYREENWKRLTAQ